MSTVPKLTLKVNNVALSEAINFCDFALKHDNEDYLITDGFIEKQATPELSNYYPGEDLNFEISNSNNTNGDLSLFKQITIRNVTKPDLLKTNTDENNSYSNILKTIFNIDNTDWNHIEATDSNEEMLVCTRDFDDNCDKCSINVKNNIDFYGLTDYYISYTVQYYYKVSNQDNHQTCVFDPLIKITNGDRR